MVLSRCRQNTVRRRAHSVAIIVVVTSIAMLNSTALAGEEPPLRLGVPAYGYPGESDLWAELAQLPAGSVVVLDPANGPGELSDTTYEQSVAAVRAAGVHIYGYVDTDYGRRSTVDMLEDVRRHVVWYSVDGVFLDQTPAAFEPAIAAVIRAAQSEGLQVSINPGQPIVDRQWVVLADHVVTFEGDAALYKRTQMPRWLWDFPADKFWHLVYALADMGQLQAVLRQASAQHAEMIYVTDGTLPNPWQRLPRYWPEELATISAHTAGTSLGSDAPPQR